MKKLLQLTLILLLSLSVYSQSREAMPVSNDGNVNHSPIFQLLISEDNSHIHTQRDNDFLKDLSYFYWWSDVYDIYKCYRRYYYTYDANHNLIEKKQNWMDGSGYINKRIYEYDVDNKMTREDFSDYTGNEWILTKITHYYYDPNNNPFQELTQVLDGSDFVDESYTQYIYENNIRTQFIDYVRQDGNWVRSLRWNDYYKNGLRDYVLVEHWSDDGNVWVNGVRAYYHYDEETSNLLVISGNNWDEEISGWSERVQRTLYSYDSINNYRTVMEVDENFYDGNGWQKVMLEAYTYVPAGSEQLAHKRNNLNKSIEDLQTTEDELVISGKQASGDRSLYGVEVMIDSVLHTSVGDLEFTLSHKGVTETIIYQVGDDGDNFINTKLTDRAYDTISNGLAPFSGIYKAENSLSAFAGVDPEGTWTLSIYDGVSGNTGTLIAWGLNLLYAENSGVEDRFTEDMTFKLFPNPTKSTINIHLAEGIHSKAVIEIYDINGKLLLVKEISSGTTSIELDVSHLPSGVYGCRLTSGKSSSTKKLMIQK